MCIPTIFNTVNCGFQWGILKIQWPELLCGNPGNSYPVAPHEICVNTQNSSPRTSMINHYQSSTAFKQYTIQPAKQINHLKQWVLPMPPILQPSPNLPSPLTPRRSTMQLSFDQLVRRNGELALCGLVFGFLQRQHLKVSVHSLKP